MITAALFAWVVLFIVGASLFAFTKHESPPETVEPGPTQDDLILIEYQTRGRRLSVLYGEPELLKCVDDAVEEAVRIGIAE